MPRVVERFPTVSVVDDIVRIKTMGMTRTLVVGAASSNDGVLCYSTALIWPYNIRSALLTILLHAHMGPAGYCVWSMVNSSSQGCKLFCVISLKVWFCLPISFIPADQRH